MKRGKRMENNLGRATKDEYKIIAGASRDKIRNSKTKSDVTRKGH